MKKYGKNYMGKFAKLDKLQNRVQIDFTEEEMRNFKSYNSSYDKKLTSMRKWCSKNSTAGWVDVPKNIGLPMIVFYFKKKEDAIHFKIVWS